MPFSTCASKTYGTVGVSFCLGSTSASCTKKHLLLGSSGTKWSSGPMILPETVQNRKHALSVKCKRLCSFCRRASSERLHILIVDCHRVDLLCLLSRVIICAGLRHLVKSDREDKGLAVFALAPDDSGVNRPMGCALPQRRLWLQTK